MVITASPASASATTDWLLELQHLLVAHFDDYDAFALACLEIGRRRLGLSTGIISHIVGQDYEVVRVLSPLKAPQAGDRQPVNDTYCAAVVRNGSPVAYYHAVGTAPNTLAHPAYGKLHQQAYLGVPIWVGNTLYGTLSFSDARARPYSFDEPAIEFIEHIATLLGRFIRREQELAALREHEQLLELSFRHDIVGKAIASPDGTIIDVNPALCRTLKRTPANLLGRKAAEFTYPDDLPLTDALYRELFDGKREEFAVEKRYICGDGEIIDARVGVALVRDAQGAPSHIVVQVIDITSSKRLQMALNELIESAPDALVLIDQQSHIVRVNARTETMFGHDREQLIGQPVDMLIPERYRERHAGMQTQYMAQPEIREMGGGLELLAMRSDGSEFPVEISLSPLQIEGRQLVSASIRDSTERHRLLLELRQSNEVLSRLSTTDPLTGLPNRRQLDKALQREMARLKRNSPALAFIAIDLDYFKHINDDYGHPVGDQVLIQFADLLRENMRATDLVARLGGEEFAVLLPDTPLNLARSFAERLREAIHEAHWPASRVTASFGIAEATSPEQGPSMLLKAADRALYAAKGAGRDCIMLADYP